MASTFDLSAVAQAANDYIWEALQEAALRPEGPATQTEVTKLVEEAVEMLLHHMKSPLPASKHVKIIIEDQNGKMTKVAIHMEALTDVGQTIMCIFGYGGSPEPGAVN